MENKIGMYGEMPVIKIGKYTISEMSDRENCNSVWIENTDTGEGGEFNKVKLLYVIDRFFNENF